MNQSLSLYAELYCLGLDKAKCRRNVPLLRKQSYHWPKQQSAAR